MLTFFPLFLMHGPRWLVLLIGLPVFVIWLAHNAMSPAVPTPDWLSAWRYCGGSAGASQDARAFARCQITRVLKGPPAADVARCTAITITGHYRLDPFTFLDIAVSRAGQCVQHLPF